MRFRAGAALLIALCSACTKGPSQQAAPTPATRHLLLITIDTLRADRVGAYGYRSARTPAIDTLAARGARFDSAFSSAPITLTSHATIMTGRYPPGHGARHNGMRLDPPFRRSQTRCVRRGLRQRHSLRPFRSIGASA